MAQQFPHYYQETGTDYLLDRPAVYKLHFGKKYFIWKGKALKGSIEQNFSDIQKYLWRADAAGHLFGPIVAYIKKARVLKGEVEVILQTDSGSDLVMKERELLQDGREDENCLNTVFEPHIPKWLAEVIAQGNPVQLPVSPLVPDPGAAMFNKTKLGQSSRKAVDVKLTQNKRPVATFTAVDDKEPIEDTIKQPVSPKNGPGKLGKLQAAFGKLKPTGHAPEESSNL